MNLWHILPTYEMALRAVPMEESRDSYSVMDGVALIEINGPTSKRGDWDTASTVNIRSQVRNAINDHAVDAIMMVIDSPGGAVSGNLELANDVASAALRKPVLAYASDMMASAAYEVGSQAMAVYANESALIGSIGTMMNLMDLSELYANLGVRVVPITSGGMKGAGTPGLPVTPDQVDYYQGIIDQMTAQFVGAVASGRNVHPTQAAQWADGRVHVAADAAKLGLIDGVMPLDQAFSLLRSQIA